MDTLLTADYSATLERIASDAAASKRAKRREYEARRPKRPEYDMARYAALSEEKKERRRVLNRAATRRYRQRHSEKHRAAKRAWEAANPDRVRESRRKRYFADIEKYREKGRNAHYKRTYGVTSADKEAMLAAQGGCCAICKGVAKNRKSWHIDHCHTTGRIRGILCSPCNGLLGLAKDNEETLLSAVEYLGLHRARN